MADKIYKQLYFLDKAYKEYTSLPESALNEFGYKLWIAQLGEKPANAKKIEGFKSVFELRHWNEDGTYRAIYTSIIKNCIVVLHAFQKKSQKTPKKNLELIKQRLKEAKAEIK